MKCNTTVELELFDNVTKNVLWSKIINHPHGGPCEDCLLTGDLDVTVHLETLGSLELISPLVTMAGTINNTDICRFYHIDSALGADIDSSGAYKARLTQIDCICDPPAPDETYESQDYLVYKLCLDGLDVHYYFDDSATQVGPNIIAMILLDELNEHNIIDWLQDTTGPYGAGNSYGPSQFTPNALSDLMSDGYYGVVGGFSGDLTDQSQLTALFEHICDPQNSPKLISAYLKKTIDYWALGTVATGGTSSNVAEPGFDISDMSGVLGTLYNNGWANGNVGVHNDPQPSDRWNDAITNTSGTVHNILFTDVDRDSLTDEEKHIYDLRDEIKSVGSSISQHINILTGVVCNPMCVEFVESISAEIDKESTEFFMDESGRTAQFMDIDAYDAMYKISESRCPECD
jgi:hypothetical protein